MNRQLQEQLNQQPAPDRVVEDANRAIIRRMLQRQFNTPSKCANALRVAQLPRDYGVQKEGTWRMDDALDALVDHEIALNEEAADAASPP